MDVGRQRGHAMSVVAIDTADRLSAWVLRTDAAGGILDEREIPGGQLDARLAEAIAELLEHDTEAIVVLTGPGSYSGVRAGMAAALGVASARHLPLHGAGNLLAVAAAARPGEGEAIVAVADAGRGGVYLARFVGRGGHHRHRGPRCTPCRPATCPGRSGAVGAGPTPTARGRPGRDSRAAATRRRPSRHLELTERATARPPVKLMLRISHPR
jgi:tRNA threonylcarbamoyl adenosine modification protein YeaZ